MKICIVLMLIFLSSVFSFSQDTTKTNLENVEISARVVGLKLDTIILGIAYYPLSFVGMEANLVANSYGDRVVLGNIYLSRKINSNSQLLIPFATIGYGVFLSDESTLLYLGCGIKYKLKSLGIRLELILGVVSEDGGVFLGPSAGISHFFKL